MSQKPLAYLVVEQAVDLPIVLKEYIAQSIFKPCSDKDFLKQQDYFLRFEDQQLSVQLNTEKKPLLFAIDFIAGKSNHRRLYGGGKKQPLAKACGLEKHPDWHIFDATGGVGKDAFVLASLGASITLCEKNPLIYNLLVNALERAATDSIVGEITERLSCINDDSIKALKQLPNAQQPDVVYLDPMYPARKKSAQIKKDMQVLQQLVGHASTADNNELFKQAFNAAKHRVVVKRPKTANSLIETQASYSVESVNTRYDVYVC